MNAHPGKESIESNNKCVASVLRTTGERLGTRPGDLSLISPQLQLRLHFIGYTESDGIHQKNRPFLHRTVHASLLWSWPLLCRVCFAGGRFRATGSGYGSLSGTLWPGLRGCWCMDDPQSLQGYQSSQQIDERKIQHPDKPWLWHKDWSSRLIQDSNRSSLSYIWFFSVFWNLISVPMSLTVLPREILQNRNYPALLGLLFPLVGAGLLIWAIRSTLRWKKFGTPILELEPFRE